MLSLPRPIQNILDFYRDPEYFVNIRKLALPIIAQQFMFSALNMAGVVFVGQKGDTAVAAVGLANQVAFLMSLVNFGIVSGAAMFTAQFWGRRDIPNLRRVLGLCLALALSTGLFFMLLSQFFPAQILNIYSNDPAVIAAGTNYLRIYGWTFFFYAVTFSYAYVMRSTGDVKTPTYIGVGALALSTFLSYALIFGKFGLPEMGIEGVAFASLIARGLECGVLLAFVYAKKSPVAASLKELFSFDTAFLGKVIKPMMPVILNELLWSLGITTYNIVYGHISTDAIAAINIIGTIEQVAFVVFIGISNSTAVLVGNRIGAGQEDEAYLYAGRSLGLGALGGILMGIILALVKTPILMLYNVSPAVIEDASRVLTIFSLFMWLRIDNMIIVVGVLRAGGDTRFSLFLDGIIIWLVGVPLAALGAFAFGLPVYFVYLFAMSEELTKWILGIQRYFSRKWINNLAQNLFEIFQD
ncbi:MAG: MATE family efflux transporter [Chloroflexi bacterium]|nr:MATE family efflux transporter [Chloroflexota bacterium]MBI3339620.1 MATE family efflux transporter [Chloroflexota bacterium]